MTVEEIMNELKSFGNEGIKQIYLRHGATEPLFGVKVQDLKKIVKRVKKDHQLSLELYATGNSDAMYLAGLIADEAKITKEDLLDWVSKAYFYNISEYTVAWIASESRFGFELGMEWIESDQEHIAACGWSTLSNLASIKKDEGLDIEAYSSLLDRIANSIHTSQNRVRYTMNGFVIAIGSFISELTSKAIETAEKIGKVSVNMGETACKVPLATTYIQKVADKGYVGKKRSQARC